MAHIRRFVTKDGVQLDPERFEKRTTERGAECTYTTIDLDTGRTLDPVFAEAAWFARIHRREQSVLAEALKAVRK